ncbi:MAG: ABC transporter permease subunit [Alphaproteobacteria bacterium]|nr:MAG: ABC transporter permease subunit [Alphaproteobacteria bacterium]
MKRLWTKYRINRKLLMLIPFVWILLFLLLPLVTLLEISLTQEGFDVPPIKGFARWLSGQTLVIQINISKYLTLYNDPIYTLALLRSLKIATLSTFFCLLASYPIAYGIARADPRYRFLLITGVMLPFWTPFLIRVYAWIGILGDHGPINNALLWLGMIREPLHLNNSLFAVCLGIVYSYMPFMVLPLYVSLCKIDYLLLEAAYDLGCRPLKAFWRIVFPLSLRGVYAGCLIVFVPVMGEYVIPELLGGIDEYMTSKILWMNFFGSSDWPQASALAIVLMCLIFFPLFLAERLTTKETEPYENLPDEGSAR